MSGTEVPSCGVRESAVAELLVLVVVSTVKMPIVS